MSVSNDCEWLEGSKVLQDLPNKHVAAALADTVVRFGKNGGADIIRGALIERLKANEKKFPAEYETAQGGRLGPGPLADIKTLLQNKEEIAPFLEALRIQRERKVKGTSVEAAEQARNAYFRYEKIYP